MFGNMNDQTTQMTQYIPMESLSKCMKEVRLLKKKNTGYDKDAFCGPGIVEIKDGQLLLYRGNYEYYKDKKNEEKLKAEKLIQEAKNEATRIEKRKKQKQKNRKKKAD